MDETNGVFEIHYYDEMRPRIYLLCETPECLNLTVLSTERAKRHRYPKEARKVIERSLKQGALLESLKEITEVNQSRSKQIA